MNPIERREPGLSGETEASVSGWTVDTLREHMNQKMNDQRDMLRREIDAALGAVRQQIADLRDSGRLMTADLRDSVHVQAEDHRRMLDERYATQTKALDAAFKAAEQAVAVALSNAEKATVKAETAAERRFESVNEFRRTLSDQTATFIPRVEYDTTRKGLEDKVNALNERANNLELRFTSRLDLASGTSTGERGAIAGAAAEDRDAIAARNSRMQLIALVIAAVVLAVGIYTTFHK